MACKIENPIEWQAPLFSILERYSLQEYTCKKEKRLAQSNEPA